MASPVNDPERPGAMTPELWRRVKAIAADALEQPADARETYVAAACGQDQRLQSEICSLLEATEAATTRFERGSGPLASSPFPAPAAIGPYRIVRELATGGMGSVYQAERSDGEYEQTVAIKIARGGGGNPFLVRRFLEERRILATLEHPNIARLLDGGTTGAGLHYVVMEFVLGEPIDAFCDRQGLDTASRLSLFLEVCEAVQYAHQRLVIHRDIKSSNILVTAEGRPKLLDFGIAKLLDPEGGPAAQAVTAVRVLTPESASPEQLTGSPMTIAVDIYALGVLLYRLLAGRSPYGGPFASEADLYRAIAEQTPVPPSRGSPRALDRELDTIVLKALAKEPERRYESVEQFTADIRRHQKGLPVLAVPDGAAYRARKFVRRHRLAVAASLALLLSLVGGIAATAWQAREADAARRRAQEQFDAVRTLAASVLGELHDAVAALPGSTPAREILVRRATAYLDALAGHAPSDDVLRREVALGYLRLGTIQGFPGGPNLGDRDAARRSMERALSLLEPPAGRPASVEERLALGQVHAHLGGVLDDEAEAERQTRLAEEALQSLTDAERGSVPGLITTIAIWSRRAAHLVAKQQWPDAEAAYRQQLAATEALHSLEPANLNTSRNLSVVLKQLGAVLEMQKQQALALELYRKALALDEQRVAAEPSRPIWRLDLSFAHGAVGAALMSAGDNLRALREYERAVALRQSVVEADPRDDFAQLSLARGFERLALIHGRLGDLPRALDASERRMAIYRERLAANPERDHLWGEFAAAAFSGAQMGHRWITQNQTSLATRAVLDHTGRLLDELESTQARWRSRGETAPLGPDAENVGKVRALQLTLSRR